MRYQEVSGRFSKALLLRVENIMKFNYISVFLRYLANHLSPDIVENRDIEFHDFGTKKEGTTPNLS